MILNINNIPTICLEHMIKEDEDFYNMYKIIHYTGQIIYMYYDSFDEVWIQTSEDVANRNVREQNKNIQK